MSPQVSYWSGWPSPSCWAGTRWSRWTRTPRRGTIRTVRGRADSLNDGGNLAGRFGPEQLAGIETAIANLVENAYRMLPVDRRSGWTPSQPWTWTRPTSRSTAP